MFLDAYKRNWVETEGYSFEDKMIDDLSVSFNSEMECCPPSIIRIWIRLVSSTLTHLESHGGRGGRGRGN